MLTTTKLFFRNSIWSGSLSSARCRQNSRARKWSAARVAAATIATQPVPRGALRWNAWELGHHSSSPSARSTGASLPRVRLTERGSILSRDRSSRGAGCRSYRVCCHCRFVVWFRPAPRSMSGSGIYSWRWCPCYSHRRSCVGVLTVCGSLGDSASRDCATSVGRILGVGALEQ